MQGKLGLDRTVRLENLTVSHFLSALDRLANPALLQFVKHLQSRAQGEVGLLFALQRLLVLYTIIVPLDNFVSGGVYVIGGS